MKWAGKDVPGPRRSAVSDTLQGRSGLEHLSLHLERHTLRLVGRSVVGHMDRPAARLDGAADRLVHPLLPARYLLPGPCLVESDHESVHCVLPHFNLSWRSAISEAFRHSKLARKS